MAEMVPAYVDPSTKSPGERNVFERLRDDPATDGWIVLHSLGLADHETQVEGEVDFVVIIPGEGVLCLEVKGGSAANIRRDERGLWYYSAHSKGESRGPFKQAHDGMHSLRESLRRTAPALAGVLFGSGVIMPFAPFNHQSVEWHTWELIESSAYRSRPLSALLVTMLRSWRRHMQSTTTRPLVDGPSPSECLALRDRLRGQFEVPVDQRTLTQRAHEEATRFTREQFQALDGMERNRRILFRGPAGTGKTFLALEAARRAGIREPRVLLLCYNRFLGEWIAERAKDLGPNVTARTIHSHMLRVAGIGRAPSKAGTLFWDRELPSVASDKLLDTLDDQHVFDMLIVDEAQDFLENPFLDFLDLSLKGGLAAGSWRMFGDFENQSIYGSKAMSVDDFLEQRGGQPADFELRVNCRNTPEVAQWVKLLAGLNPDYASIRRQADGVVPRIFFYRDREDQERLLLQALSELQRSGFGNSQIAVLSTRKDQGAASAVTTTPWRDKLRPMTDGLAGHIRYGTIQAFKGLETDAVIVTDIESITSDYDRSLIYIAATRPLQRLVVIAHERVRAEITRLLGF